MYFIFFLLFSRQAKPPRQAETSYWHEYIPLPKLKTKHHIIRVSCIPLLYYYQIMSYIECREVEVERLLIIAPPIWNIKHKDPRLTV